MLVAGSLVILFRLGSVAAGDKSPDLRLPPDVTYGAAEGSPGPVVFSHTLHVALADNKCIGCHPAAFPILKPTGRITHAEMDAGAKCGICHDGSEASGVQDDCENCHQMTDGS